MKPETVRVTRAFIDAIEEGSARVLVGERAANIPRSVLPDAAREGSWIELRITTVAAPAESARTEEERRKLSRDDDGGDFKL